MKKAVRFRSFINVSDHCIVQTIHISSKFLKINDLKLKSNSVVQQKTFCNIFNFSKYVLPDCEKSLLTKG